MPEILGPEIPTLLNFSGEIQNNAGEHVAEICSVPLRWYGNRPEDSVYLRAPITFVTLSLLNESRAAGAHSVQLTFALDVDMQGRKEWQRQSVELVYRFAASDWLALLEQARHTQVSTIEVCLEGPSVPAGLKAAADRYREAMRHLQLCQWDDAIADCRQVIDDMATAIGATEPAPGWAQHSDKNTREGWTFSERCGTIRNIVRHATHLAHHGQSEFTALQARYVTELTGVLLKFYSGRLSQ
jgi:hypothetical protein